MLNAKIMKISSTIPKDFVLMKKDITIMGMIDIFEFKNFNGRQIRIFRRKDSKEIMTKQFLNAHGNGFTIFVDSVTCDVILSPTEFYRALKSQGILIAKYG